MWIVQNNLYREAGYTALLETLVRLGIPHSIVKVVPLTGQLIPAEWDTFSSEEPPQVFIPVDTAIVVIGSYTLARLAVSKGWKPGANLTGLDYSVWGHRWPDAWLLNPKATVLAFKDVVIDRLTFIRPVEDSKSFSGKVFSSEEWRAWQQTVLSTTDENDPLSGSTEVMLSKPTEIYTETRLFVVDRKVVTYSGYKRGSRVVYYTEVDSEVLDFAQQCLSHWVPNDAFVLDIAQTENGPKIVEVNCLNAAGLYACDVNKIVMALEEKRLSVGGS